MMELAEADNRFPLSFYYKIADQIIKQAKVLREEGNTHDLCVVLGRYVRLVTDIIPQHKSYRTSSSKERLQHKKTSEEYAKELEKLKLLYPRNDKEISDACCRQITKKLQTSASYTESKAVELASADGKKSKSCKHCGRTAACGATVCETPCSASPRESRSNELNVHVVRQSFPPQILSCVESVPLVGPVSQLVVPESRTKSSDLPEDSASKSFQDIHISARLMEEFIELARCNTEKDLETCGVLGAFLKNGTFYATTLIIPKQESTSSSCQALNEEDIYSVQEEQSLFPVGWIHTHPSQTCFMSSIDLHTQYSYQVMLSDAVAIVMAPTDATRSYGIFRLTDPEGITVLRDCQEQGFHTHKEPLGGGPLYESCSNVYINPNLRFEIIDFR